jgi:hypothetical protein
MMLNDVECWMLKLLWWGVSCSTDDIIKDEHFMIMNDDKTEPAIHRYAWWRHAPSNKWYSLQPPTTPAACHLVSLAWHLIWQHMLLVWV